MIGTSDNSAIPTEHPKVTDAEVDYLLENVNRYFGIKINKGDIQGKFSGLRPLLKQEDATDTAMVVREHSERFSDSGLLTIAGGKWTSYRSMAQSAVDMVLHRLGKNIQNHPCKTEHYALVGSQHLIPHTSLPHTLHCRYGDQAPKIVEIATLENAQETLHTDLDISKAELLYTIRHEYVRKPLDFIVRRVNLGLIDQPCAMEVVEKVSTIIGEELCLSQERVTALKEEAIDILNHGV